LAVSSAAKATRQAQKKALHNRSVESAMKTVMTRAQRAIAKGDLKAAGPLVKKAQQALDQAAAKGVIHPNNASRRKSRLTGKYLQARESQPKA